MSLSSRFHFLVGTPQVADIRQLAAFMTVAKMARSVTVKIQRASGGGGSGVIVKRQDTIYTVLTANLVVNNTGVEYTIHTNQEKDYPVTKVLRLGQRESEPDLALVQFSSPDKYPVASLGNSDAGLIGTNIYVSGYPATISTQTEDFEFTNGIIIDRPNGKLLRYYAVGLSGMSGAPIFNASVQVIGIHVAPKLDLDSRTGFNMAVPVNTCIALLNPRELNCSDLKVALILAQKD